MRPTNQHPTRVKALVVYLDGILRTASVVVPKRNARELAASVFEHVSAKLMKPLAPEPSNGGSPAEVKKFTAFGVRNLELRSHRAGDVRGFHDGGAGERRLLCSIGK
jgi:hypothetical protein